jgi:hypothetical protein
VLEDDDFIAWANENVVIVLGHDGAVGDKEQHKPVEVTDPKTKEKKEICPLYDGLTCEEHKAIRRDAASPKDGLGKIDIPSGFPNTWMVGPDGTVEKIDPKDQQVAKNVEDALVAFQKKFEGKPLPWKKYDAHRKSISEGDKALEEGKWKAALAAYAKVDADAKKLPKGMLDRLKAKLDAANEKIVAKFAELRDGEGDAAAKAKSVKALRADVGAKFSTGALAVVAEMDTWIKESAAVPASPPK